MEKNNRSTFSGNIGFILAAIGSAVGMGNLWGFPYKMGANGGFAFLIIYLAFVIFCGVIVMSVEMAIGRKTGKSPILAMAELGKQFKFIGWFGVLSATIIMGFYAMLVGYAVRYMLGFLIQIVGMSGFGGMGGTDFFISYTCDPLSVLLYTLITFAVCYIIVASGIEGGIEKFNKVGIPALFGILIVIIIYNFTLPGASQGLTFMFTTKGMEMAGTQFDFFKAARIAAGQMLFSCSLGMGIMITYGSYLKKDSNISVNAWIIPAADTLAALLAGLAIFPAVFAQGQTPNGGPGLLFMTMHDTFTSMGWIGNVIGFLFYLLVIFAGVSSCISLMEVTSAHFIDSSAAKGKPVSRKKAVGIVTLIMVILSIPVCLDQLGMGTIIPGFYNSFMAEGSKDLLDVYDLLSEGIMMPLAAMLTCIVIGWKVGMPWVADEIEQAGNKFHLKNFVTFCVKYITPLMMAFVFVALVMSYVSFG